MTKSNATKRHWVHLVLSLSVLVLSMILFSVINQQPSPKESILIKDLKSVVSSTDLPPPINANWTPVTLPDDWFRRAENKNHEFKWYSFTLPSSRISSKTTAFYLTYTSRPVSIYINEQLIFEPDFPASKIARTWGQSQFIKIKFDDLIKTTARQKFRVKLKLPRNQSASGSLGKIYFGTETVLRNAFEQDYFVKVTLVKLLIVAMVLSSLFVLLLWFFRRRDTVNVYYAIAVVLWAIYSYSHLAQQLVIPEQFWEWLRMTSILFWTVSIAFFCNRFLNSPHPIREKVLLLQATLISASLLFIGPSLLYWLADYVLPAYTTIVGFYSAYRMIRETLLRKDSDLTWLTMCGMMVMLLAAHDIAVLAHWVPIWNGLYLHYAALVLLIVFNTILIKRFVGTLNEVQQLNDNLEKRITDKTEELKTSYQQLHRLENEKILNNERERIMRDMHDGVGGTLLSLRSELERGDWSEKDILEGLRTALDDLYMMIHSLDPYGSDLTIALGSIRHTLGNRLRRAGIELKWVVNETPFITDLAPSIVLTVMRIMQEATSNIIKHSGASTVVICIPVLSNQDLPPIISISITDNGCGIERREDLQIKTSEGYGLPGMKNRAEKIGAEVFIQEANPGTRVLLRLPVSTLSSN